MSTTTIDLNRVGRIDLMDLNFVNEYLGREFLPFPFVPTLPNRFTYFDEYAAHAAAVPDRFNHGDLRQFKKWFGTFTEADLRVECRVQYFGEDTPPQRLLAHRCDQLGFLAVQGPDDVVDIYSLSPYDLGPAIAASVDLTNPGARAAIAVPEYVPLSLRDRDDDQCATSGPPMTVPSNEVQAYATVQSHSRPARDWGVDQDKDAVVWVRLKDGDYIYVPGYEAAKPMTRQLLRDRIDQLIADDVALLRQSRSG